MMSHDSGMVCTVLGKLSIGSTRSRTRVTHIDNLIEIMETLLLS
jgi:hypothetical protein